MAEVFQELCKAYQLPVPDKEVRFDASRRWRFDYAYPDIKLGIEIEGGVWANGRHVRGDGYINDCEKYNEAQIQGWKVLRFVPSQVSSGIAFRTLARALEAVREETVAHDARQLARELRAEQGVRANVYRDLQNPILQTPDPVPKRRGRPRKTPLQGQADGSSHHRRTRPLLRHLEEPEIETRATLIGGPNE
jgi:very-short-patch-repair endonuclease